MRMVLVAVLTGCLSTVASGQETGRYSMTPVESGFLRLDTRTGEVALCKLAGESVECRATANERSALETEIDRLAKENAELKSRLGTAQPTPRLQEDMNRALDFAERFMRRMMRIMREETPQERT